jgi:hypothetical protein
VPRCEDGPCPRSGPSTTGRSPPRPWLAPRRDGRSAS